MKVLQSSALKRTTTLLTLLLVSLVIYSKAASSENVNTTVNVGVCGNNIAEGNEDCDNTDLKGKTCKDLDYSGGTLSCHSSCTFDTSLCTSKTTSGSNNKSTGGTQTSVYTETNTAAQTKPTLPEFLKLFDTNFDGRIDAGEILGATKKWYDSWKLSLSDTTSKGEGCDLDNNKRCDVVDFSILLYYIGR